MRAHRSARWARMARIGATLYYCGANVYIYCLRALPLTWCSTISAHTPCWRHCKQRPSYRILRSLPPHSGLGADRFAGGAPAQLHRAPSSHVIGRMPLVRARLRFRQSGDSSCAANEPRQRCWPLHAKELNRMGASARALYSCLGRSLRLQPLAMPGAYSQWRHCTIARIAIA